MPKMNLVLVHSFPTNSILLRGLKEFLDVYFKVHFVDLPGFSPRTIPLKNISLDYYSHYVSEYVSKLKLKYYLLSGVSFGFLVVNNIKNLEKCRGFIAIEPFINKKLLSDAIPDLQILKWTFSIISYFHIHKAVYHSNVFKKYLLRYYPLDRVETILDTIDGFTFFETAKLILTTNNIPKFHNVPYVLVINVNDKTIASKGVIKTFKPIKKLLVIPTTSDHFPKHPTKEYFQNTIKKKDIDKMIDFLSRDST